MGWGGRARIRRCPAAFQPNFAPWRLESGRSPARFADGQPRIPILTPLCDHFGTLPGCVFIRVAPAEGVCAQTPDCRRSGLVDPCFGLVRASSGWILSYPCVIKSAYKWKLPSHTCSCQPVAVASNRRRPSQLGLSALDVPHSGLPPSGPSPLGLPPLKPPCCGGRGVVPRLAGGCLGNSYIISFRTRWQVKRRQT